LRAGFLAPAGKDHHSKLTLARKISAVRCLPRPGSAVVATRLP
jgi:hypothetical protein